MSTSPSANSQRVVYVDLEDKPEVTQEGFFIALGCLYSSSSLSLVRPDNARGVLAAGCLLGGLDGLCSAAYETCQRSISIHSLDDWLAFVESTQPSSPDSPDSTPASTSTTVLGPYAQLLRADVLHFLLVTLPSSQTNSASASDARETLLDVFARFSFDLFKTAIESPDLQIGSDRARFKFAQEAIARRKRAHHGAGAEETVVLAFGGSNANAGPVHVTCKVRRKALWKVSA